ncbi:MAG: hypothetical protein B7X00_00580 [Legionella sp. 21-45-4]|nr:MAG: hypothetical protein B7X00_00580 [Legionella sp. 21-45-4]
MANQDYAFSFPCQFPIKVIGKNTDDFVSNMGLTFTPPVNLNSTPCTPSSVNILIPTWFSRCSLFVN